MHRLKQLLKKIPLNRCYQWVMNLIGYLPKKKYIVFESFYGKMYSDNPKALYLYAKQYYPEYDLIWNAKKGYEHIFEEAGVPYVVDHSLKALWIQARAKYWIVNTRQPQWKYPTKGTILLQTWHGTPLKRLGLDIEHVTMPGVTTEQYRKEFLVDTSKWDYMIAPNPYSSDIFEHAFQLSKQQLIPSGYPRNDRLFRYTTEEVEQLKRQLEIPLDAKVLLYAPTWRDTDNHGQGHYYMDIPLDIQALLDAYPSLVLLVRSHYLISEHLDLKRYGSRVKDVSHIQDITDLYLISDMLMTDYSSVFFDYANLKRPMIFYAYDEQDYANETRGFYFDYQTVPGPIVHTTEEVIAALAICWDDFSIDQSYRAFLETYCQYEDGEASARVFEHLFEEV